MTRTVLDANFGGRGQFNRARLERLALKLAGTGTEFVIPEVVLWEWAEHAHASFESLGKQHETFKVDPVLIGLPVLPLPLGVDDLYERIVAQLPAGFEVWKPSGDDFRESLRAQVLQVGAGERKEGVKTGAADHLVFLCARDQINNRRAMEAVVVATGDRALRELCEAEFGEEVLCARDDRELLSRLITFMPAEDELREAVEESLLSRVNAPGSDIEVALARFSMGFAIVDRPERPSSWDRERLSLQRAEILELHEFEVGEARGDGRRVGAALVRIFGPVHLEVSTIEPIGEDDFERVPVYQGTMQAMIDLPLTVIFEPDWSIGAAEAAGPANVDFNT